MDTASAALALYVWSRLRATRWRIAVRALAPIAVAAVFVLGVGLALHPGVALRSSFNRATLHSMTSQAANGAIDFARSTRAVARQIRSSVTS
jgi:hypothetical protein